MSQPEPVAQAPARTHVFRLEGMHCGSCVARIEQGLKQAFPQLSNPPADVRVNLATGQAIVEGSVEPEAVVGAVEKLGYRAVLIEKPGGQAGESVHVSGLEVAKAKKRLLVAVLLTMPLFALHMARLHFVGSGWAQLLLATPVLFWCGLDIFRSAWQLLKRFDSNMDTLVSLGAGVAWLYSVALLILNPQAHEALYFETAAMIVALILLGRYLEARARGKAGAAIEALMRLQPETALLVRDGEPLEVSVGSLQVGDIVLVRSGGAIPLDGQVVDGETEVNEAMLTGESLAVVKKPGDCVIGGAMNQSGSITITVTHAGHETVLARMIALVGRAQSGKPPIQRLADKIAGIFVPVVLILAALTLIGWLWAGYSWAEGISAAIAVLVIACPCALGLATPTAIQVGLGKAASQGILIRDTDGLELAHKLDILVMDKTGTLTMGQPEVAVFQVLPAFSETDCLRWAAALESRSEHPLAQAIVNYATAQGVDWQSCEVRDFASQAGTGVLGMVAGKRVVIGKPAFLVEHGVIVAPISHKMGKAAEQGRTPVLMAVNEKPVGYFLLADPLKAKAPEAIRRLRKLGIRPFMLSGDRQETAVAIGRQAGLSEGEIKANVLPHEKLEFLKDLQREGDDQGRKVVGMVGDGINDAPALAQADVSIAMGTGTDIAMQTAQITLVHGDIAKAVEAILLSRAILRTIRQNLFWAFFYNFVAIPAAALGYLNPVIAAVTMSLSSITVVLNSLRLNREPVE